MWLILHWFCYMALGGPNYQIWWGNLGRSLFESSSCLVFLIALIKYYLDRRNWALHFDTNNYPIHTGVAKLWNFEFQKRPKLPHSTVGTKKGNASMTSGDLELWPWGTNFSQNIFSYFSHMCARIEPNLSIFSWSKLLGNSKGHDLDLWPCKRKTTS